MSNDHQKYLRNATIYACGDENTSVLEQLKEIPGYVLQEVAESHAGNRTHVLITPSGDEIHLVNDESDPSKVRTSNIMKQDATQAFVPYQQDELVQLAKAANPTEKVNVVVSTSAHDLETLGVEPPK